MASLISIKFIIKSHLKGIKDSAIMSSEMIIVNIRRRKIDKSDDEEEEEKRVIDGELLEDEKFHWFLVL